MSVAEETLAAELQSALTGLDLLAKSGQEWAYSSEVASVLRTKQLADIHWRRVQSLLDSDRQLVGRRKRSRRWQYCLLKDGKRRVGTENSSIVLVDPTKAVHDTIAFHELLSGLQGCVRICDPYIDASSIEHLDALPNGVDVRYLSFHVKGDGTLRRLISAFHTTGRKLEVRLLAKAEIHDRYIIDSANLTILGSSINGLGKKQSFIIRAGQDMRRVMLKCFKEQWERAATW